MGVDLHQLLLAARLLAVKVGHVLLRLGADLGAAAAHVVGAEHVLHHRPDGTVINVGVKHEALWQKNVIKWNKKIIVLYLLYTFKVLRG